MEKQFLKCDDNHGTKRPILNRFRAAVAEIYGERLERVVLFGSRVQGDARPDSDYDVAVFLRYMPDRFAEMDRLADVAMDILYRDGELSTPCPIAPIPTMMLRR